MQALFGALICAVEIFLHWILHNLFVSAVNDPDEVISHSEDVPFLTSLRWHQQLISIDL